MKCGAPIIAGALFCTQCGMHMSPDPDPPQNGPDKGPFLRLGNQFRLPGGKPWAGRTVVSPRGFYLVKEKVVQEVRGGLIGGLINVALDSGLEVSGSRLDELPALIRAQLDPRKKFGDRDAIVLPKEAVTFVGFPFLNNVVNVRIDQSTFSLEVGLFSRRSIRRFLEANGWTVGEKMTTAGAAPGPDGAVPYRPVITRVREPMGTTARVVSIIIAIVLLVLLGALSVAIKGRGNG